jgi:hypothetical protein
VNFSPQCVYLMRLNIWQHCTPHLHPCALLEVCRNRLGLFERCASRWKTCEDLRTDGATQRRLVFLPFAIFASARA